MVVFSFISSLYINPAMPGVSIFQKFACFDAIDIIRTITVRCAAISIILFVIVFFICYLRSCSLREPLYRFDIKALLKDTA